MMRWFGGLFDPIRKVGPGHVPPHPWPAQGLPPIDNDPPPMPNIGAARVYLPDAVRALARAGSAWNATQLRDALASAKFFIARAEAAIVDDVRDAPPPKPTPPPIQVIHEDWWPVHPCG